MGAVYLATDALFGDRLCAVKELLGDPAATAAEAAEAEERFAREARLLASLEHPNLPKVFDYFSEQGKSYLVMEFIDGETLEQRVAREGAQGQEQVLAWALEMCAALEYLHAQTPPVIFRDVAPDNIMVDSAGHVKLIDFGIARVFNPSKQTDTLRFGKVGYAPPEQYSGRGQTTPRSDIFALGATLHFVLTSRDPADLPFVFPPLRDLNPSVSAEVEQVILSAVQMDPSRRPADVRAFAEGLGLTLPPLALSSPSAALVVETPTAPARPACPEQRLVAFRLRNLQTQQRKARKMRQMLVFVVLVCICVPVLGVIFLSAAFTGYGFSFSEALPFLSFLFPIILIAPPIIVANRKINQTYPGRARVAIGRQGILLLHSRPLVRRKFISWEEITAVEVRSSLPGHG
jgi:serine/threonine protein kinase